MRNTAQGTLTSSKSKMWNNFKAAKSSMYIKSRNYPGMLVHTYNLNTEEISAGKSEVHHPQLQGELENNLGYVSPPPNQ